jgi:hypothetical protein
MAEQSLVLPANIRNGLKYLNDLDARTFLKKCRQQSGDERQLAHTKMELIAGVFATMMGFTPQYEPKMEGQTPDWLFLCPEAKPHFFGDVVNFHINEAIEKKMEEDLQNHLYWRGDLPGSEVRLNPSLTGKASKYKELADCVDLPFVVFVYPWFEAFVHPKEVEYCLRDWGYGLFKDYPQLSGIYHFDDARPVGRGWVDPAYHFRFYANPTASRPLDLADGLVPLPIPDPSVRNDIIPSG